MVQLRIRRDHHSRAHALSTPAQVEIVTEERELRIKSAERVPHISTHEHAGRAHGQDIADSVVLALIVFARFQAGDPSTCTTHGDAHFKHQAPVMPAKNLRSENRSFGVVVGRIEQRLKAIGVGSCIVV